MSFTRVNPSGWAAHDIYTAAQATALDIDHANAFDKTASDDLGGVGVVYHVLTSTSFQVDSGATIFLLGSAGLNATVTGALQASAAGAVQSTIAGGFQHAGGASDWVTFSATRSRSPMLWPRFQALGTGWTFQTPVLASMGGLQGPATNAVQYVLIDQPHNGSTLTSVKVWFIVNGPHASLPAVLPAFGMYRATVGSNTTVAMSTTAAQSPAPANGPAWDASSAVQSFTVTCNQNNVIDTSQYTYMLKMVDENGANAATGNLYIAIQPTYSAIGSMQFP